MPFIACWKAHLFHIETSSCGLFFSTPPSENEQKWDVNGPQCSESLKNSSLVLASPQLPRLITEAPASVFEERTVQWYKWQSRSLPLPSPFSFQIPYFPEFSGLTGTGVRGRLRSGKKELLPCSEGWGNPEPLKEAGTHCLLCFFEGGIPFPSSSSPQCPSIQPWGENGGGYEAVKAVIV